MPTQQHDYCPNSVRPPGPKTLSTDECLLMLREKECLAYHQICGVFRAQGHLLPEKLKLLKEIAAVLKIPEVRHKTECRIAVNNRVLNTIADCVAGPGTDVEWRREAKDDSLAGPEEIIMSASFPMADALARFIGRTIKAEPHQTHFKRTINLKSLMAEYSNSIIKDQCGSHVDENNKVETTSLLSDDGIEEKENYDESSSTVSTTSEPLDDVQTFKEADVDKNVVKQKSSLDPDTNIMPPPPPFPSSHMPAHIPSDYSDLPSLLSSTSASLSSSQNAPPVSLNNTSSSLLTLEIPEHHSTSSKIPYVSSNDVSPPALLLKVPSQLPSPSSSSVVHSVSLSPQIPPQHSSPSKPDTSIGINEAAVSSQIPVLPCLSSNMPLCPSNIVAPISESPSSFSPSPNMPPHTSNDIPQSSSYQIPSPTSPISTTPPPSFNVNQTHVSCSEATCSAEAQEALLPLSSSPTLLPTVSSEVTLPLSKSPSKQNICTNDVLPPSNPSSSFLPAPSSSQANQVLTSQATSLPVMSTQVSSLSPSQVTQPISLTSKFLPTDPTSLDSHFELSQDSATPIPVPLTHSSLDNSVPQSNHSPIVNVPFTPTVITVPPSSSLVTHLPTSAVITVTPVSPILAFSSPPPALITVPPSCSLPVIPVPDVLSLSSQACEINEGTPVVSEGYINTRDPMDCSVIPLVVVPPAEPLVTQLQESGNTKNRKRPITQESGIPKTKAIALESVTKMKPVMVSAAGFKVPPIISRVKMSPASTQPSINTPNKQVIIQVQSAGGAPMLQRAVIVQPCTGGSGQSKTHTKTMSVPAKSRPNTQPKPKENILLADTNVKIMGSAGHAKILPKPQDPMIFLNPAGQKIFPTVRLPSHSSRVAPNTVEEGRSCSVRIVEERSFKEKKRFINLVPIGDKNVAGVKGPKVPPLPMYPVTSVNMAPTTAAPTVSGAGTKRKGKWVVKLPEATSNPVPPKPHVTQSIPPATSPANNVIVVDLRHEPNLNSTLADILQASGMLKHIHPSTNPDVKTERQPMAVQGYQAESSEQQRHMGPSAELGDAVTEDDAAATHMVDSVITEVVEEPVRRDAAVTIQHNDIDMLTNMSLEEFSSQQLENQRLN